MTQYNSVVLTGRNASGKSRLAAELQQLIPDSKIYGSSDALIRNGALLSHRHPDMLSRGIDYYTQTIIAHGNPSLHPSEVPTQACYEFGLELYQCFTPVEIADAHMAVAQEWLGSGFIIYEGLRYAETVRRFKDTGSMIVSLEAPRETLIHRLVNEKHVFPNNQEAEAFLAKCDRLYGFEEIPALAHHVFNTEEKSLEVIASEIAESLGVTTSILAT